MLNRRIRWSAEDYINWTYTNQAAAFALVTPTKWKSIKGCETVSRFCFINPVTTKKEIEDILKSME